MSRESRATAGPVAVAALTALTVCLAAVVASAAAVSLPSDDPVVVHLTAHADGRLALTLVAGGPLDTRRIGLRVRVDGRSLAHQPPAPVRFFDAPGFRGGPRGPFNSHADPRWTTGETATVRVAHTNHPFPRRGRSVTVSLSVENQRVAVLHARVT